MDYDEKDFLMLSGIQHFAFCRRQWALICIEQQWNENYLTAEGELLHEKAHNPYLPESRGDVFVSRGMPVFSRTLGVSGQCDIVEFYKDNNGVFMPVKNNKYIPYPVEYKHGRPKNADIDRLQLTAQAICLEEMLVCNITGGAIFYGQTRHREKVVFTDDLREQVKKICCEMHSYFARGTIPKVKISKSCNSCSLNGICLPKLAKVGSARAYNELNLGDGT